eukprot:4295997-Amphidinium_carterae.1
MPEVGPQLLALTAGTVSQTTASRAEASENQRTMTTNGSDDQFPLPAPEVTLGAVVSVASAQYEIREKLGRGAAGSVHRATPRCEATDRGGRLGQGGGPDS